MRSLVLLAALAGMAACGSKPDTIEVSRAKFEATGKQWPLTVDAGRVGCKSLDLDAEERWVEAGGVKYGLNSFATTNKGYADITPIWRENVRLTKEVEAMFRGQKLKSVNRISIGGLSDLASTAC